MDNPSTKLKEINGQYETILQATNQILLKDSSGIQIQDYNNKPINSLIYIKEDSKPSNILSNGNSTFDQILKFSGQNSSDKVKISPTGFMATSQCQKEHLLLTNKSFSQGKVYFEFIAPSDCSGMQLGVIDASAIDKENVYKDPKLLLVQGFRTTTPRIIGIEIDFEGLKLKYWLNGTYLQSRVKNLTVNTSYIPCVLLTMPKSPPLGCQIIINPFVNIYVEKLSVLSIRSNLSSKLSQAVDPEKIQSLTKLFNIIKAFTFNNQQPQQCDLQNSKFYYMKSNSNLVINKENYVKLIQKSQTNQYELDRIFFSKLPSSVNDVIILEIPFKDIKYLLISILLSVEIQPVQDFIHSIYLAFENIKQNNLFVIKDDQTKIKVELAYLTAYQAIQQLIIQEENTSKNQICLNILAHIDEQLFQMIQHENIDNGLRKCYQRPSRPFTTLHRLASLQNYPSPFYSVMEMAQNGLINREDVLFQLRNYLNQEQQIESLTLINHKDVTFQEKISNMLPDHPQTLGLPHVNVSLSHSVNYQPYVYVPMIEKIMPCKDYLVITQKNGKVSIFNTLLGLIELVNHDFNQTEINQQKNFEKNKNQGSWQDDPYNEGFHQLFIDYFQEDLTNKDQSKKLPKDDDSSLSKHSCEDVEMQSNSEEVEVEEEEEITPDITYLDQLITMGYTLEISKKALIQTKNLGLYEAIEVIPQIIQEKTQKKSKDINRQLTIWSCPDCTFINNNNNHNCEVCDKEAPDHFYMLVDQKKEASRKASINMSEKSEKIIVPQTIQHKKSFLQDSIQKGSFVFQLNSRQYPIIVGLIFQQENNLKFRLKRFGFNEEYLSQYYSVEEGKNITCSISGRSLISENPQEIEDFLFNQESRFTIESLGPYFNGINKKGASNSVWTACDKLDFEFQADRLLDYQTVSDDNLHQLNLWVLRQELCIFYQYQVEVKPFKLSQKCNLEVKQTIKMNLIPKLNLDLPLRMNQNQDQLFIWNGQSVFIQKQENLQKFSLNFDFQDLQGDQNVIIGLKNMQKIFLLNKNNEITEKTNELAHPQIDLIQYMQQLKQNQYIPSMANATYSNMVDFDSQIFTKHFWHVEPIQKTFTIDFTGNIEVSGVFINFYQSEIKQTEQYNQKEIKSLIQQDGLFLPLRVFSFKGAQYNAQIPVCNLLYPQELFVSNYANTSFIFEHLHKKTMLINTIKVNSSEKPLHGGYPIGSGLVFLSNTPSSFQLAEEYVNMQPIDYKNYLQNLKSPPLPHQPVGCFSEDDPYVELDFKRPAKFMFILPTNMRKTPDNFTKFFSSTSIEIKFIGVQGTILEDQQEISQSLKREPQQIKAIQQLAVQSIEVLSDESGWVPAQGIINNIQEESSQIQILNENRMKIRSLRMTVNNANNQIQTISMQGFNSLLNMPQYNDIMTQLDVYNDFYKKIVNDVTHESKIVRQKAIKSLIQILNNIKDHLQNVFQDIDFYKFLQLNILQSDGVNIIDIQKLLAQFMEDEEIQQKVQNYVSQCLKNLEKHKLTRQGLQSFMIMLNMFNQQMEDELLTKLQQVSIYVKRLKNPHYSVLRTQYNIASMSFEHSLFSTQNIHFIESSPIQEIKNQFLPVMCHQQQTYCGQEMIIKLPGTFSIEEILFGVDLNTDNKFKYKQKMRLQIYEVIKDKDQYRKVLIHDESLNSATWYQISQYAHFPAKHEGHFDQSQNLECVGTGSINNLKARYLIVQFIHYLQPHQKSLDEGLPLNNILPLIKGEPCVDSIEEIISIESIFKNISEVSNKTIVLQNQQKFQCFNNEKNQPIYTLTNIESSEKKLTIEEKKNLLNKQENLQNSLQKSLIFNRESGLNFQDQIVSICKQIEEIQIQLISDEPKEVIQSTDFFITLAMEISFLLRKSYKRKKIFQNNQILTKVLEIIENLVIYECKPKNSKRVSVPKEICIYENIISLVKDVIKKHLSEKQWLHIVIQIINGFLIKPINFKTSSLKNLYSQGQIIDCLNELQVPNQEILSFIAQKLGIQYNTEDLKFNKPPIDSNKESLKHVVFSLTSILNLLNKGFKQLQSDIIYDPLKVYHQDIYCFNCQKDKTKYLEGLRMKCLNCLNLNCCSNKNCYDKHKQEFPDHTMIYIDEPLPLVPENQNIQNPPHVLSLPLNFEKPLENNHMMTCEVCLQEIDQQPRMMCANCEEYNICYGCYTNQKEKHVKYHVFVRLDHKLVKNETQSSKYLFQALDPMLYPIKNLTNIDDSSCKLRKNSNYYDGLLEPLKIKRFFSHQQKQIQNLLTIENENELICVPKLDYQQSYMVAFGICVWICDNNSLSEMDKKNLISLSFQMLNSMMSLTNPMGIKETLKNQNYFLSLIFNIWKYGSISQNLQLKQFLYKLIQLPNEKCLTMEQQTNSEIKSLLLYHLQTFQKYLLDQQSKQQSISVYTQLFGQNIPVNIWIEHLTFTLEFLLDSSEVLNQSKQNVSDLVPLGINKSLSYNQEQSHKPQSIQIQNKMFTINIVQSLINLLNNQTLAITFQNLAKLWTLILRTIQMFQVDQLIDSKIFENIVHSFFSASQEIQNTVLGKMLNFTKHLLQNNNTQREMSSLVSIIIQIIDTIFKCFENGHNVIKYRLITGWLDILLNINSVPAVPPNTETTQSCKLDISAIANLLSQISVFLKKHLQIGGSEGAELGSECTFLKMKIATDLLQILTSSIDYGKIQLLELFSNHKNYTNLIKASVHRYIEWYLINKKSESANSPCNTQIRMINDHLMKLFLMIKEQYIYISYEEVTRLAIYGLIQACKNQDEIIKKLVKHYQIPLYVAYKLNQNWCDIMENLCEIWLHSDQLALEAAFNQGGLDFLLNKISMEQGVERSLTDIDESSIQVEEKNDLLSFQEEECANLVTIQNLANQNIINYPPDWSIYKKGNKTKLFYFDMSGDHYHEYELVIKLQNPTQMKKLIMGFNSATIEINQKVLGVPSSIILEGGMDINSLQPLGTLQQIQDTGYSIFSVSVFTKNFMKMDNEGGKLSDQIKSLNYPTVQYLKFIIRRPHVSFVEGLSYLNGKVWSNVFVSLSFLTISGFNQNKLPSQILPYMQSVQKKMAFFVMGKLCDPTYTDTLNILANNQDVVRKIQSNFEMLQGNLNKYKNWLVPVFLVIEIIQAIATHNSQMGDWLTWKFLEFNRADSHSKLILDIILVSSQNSFKRIKMVYDCIMANLNNLVFIDTFCSAIHLTEMREKLEFGKDQVDFLIENYNQTNADAITRVIITMIYYFNMEVLGYAIDKIWDLFFKEKKHDYLQMLGPLLLGSQNAVQFLTIEKVTFLADKIIRILQAYTIKKHRKLNNLLYFVYCVVSCRDRKINNQFIQYHKEIYQSTKIHNDLKDIEGVNFDLIFKILKELILGDKDLQEDFTSLLIQDLSSLSLKKIVVFAQHFLVPFLNATQEIPVSLQPVYNKENKQIFYIRPAYEGFQFAFQSKEKDIMQSKILNKSECQQFQDAIKPITQKIFGNKKYQFNLIGESNGANAKFTPAMVNKVLKSCLEQPPYFVLIQGSYMDKNCVIGAFCSEKMSDQVDEQSSYELSYSIPFGENNFLFYLENEVINFFQAYAEYEISSFGYYQTSQQGYPSNLSFSEALYINFEFINQTSVDFDPSLFKMMDLGKTNVSKLPDYYIDVFKRIEFFSLKVGSSDPNQNQNFAIQNYFANKTQMNPWSFYRYNPVVIVPKDLPLQDINRNVLIHQHKLSVNKQQNSSNQTIQSLYEENKRHQLLDVYFDITDYEATENQENNQFTSLQMFEIFQKLGGVQRLIEALLKSLTQWKNKDRSQKWFMWVKEIASFSELPSFFSLFIKNKVCIDLLFKILSQEPDLETDKDKIKKWQEEELKAVKFSYKILAVVFLLDKSSNIRVQALEKTIIQSILDRLQFLSKESCRKWQENDVSEPNQPQEEKIVEQKPVIDEKQTPKLIKKQGVGYGSDNTGQNQKWNVSEYQTNVALKYEQIEQLLCILENFFSFTDWELPSSLIELVLSSCLLPMLESDFRSSSLLEMSKNSKIYTRELNLVKLFSNNSLLIKLLQPISKNYKPQQIDSIFNLLEKLGESAQIFQKVHQAAQIQLDKSKETSLLLSEKITETLNYIQPKIQINIISIPEEVYIRLPLTEQYKILLKDLRFGYMSMQENSIYTHHYASYLDVAHTPPTTQIIRLAQELADISTALPIEHTNAIFVRADSSHINILKALIFGSVDTPYAHGAFEFDIFFEDSYPNNPPKVNLMTTGNGQVRFNPNLYACGKVCLSLLGTWRGNASENWDPKLSTLLQVLVSIQAIIMSDDVYFNEPGFENEADSKEGQERNEAYSNIVKYCNVMYAMIGQIEKPSNGFETVIRRHFYLKRALILEDCQKWLSQAEQKPAAYIGLISDHNANWCQKFKVKGNFVKMFKEALTQLENVLKKLDLPPINQVQQKDTKKLKAQQVKNQENIQVDVGYDKILESKVLDFEDETVKDRWSRNIGVMGIDALKKQAQSVLIMFGFNGTAVEIAKNIILSGVKKFIIYDDQMTTYKDLSGMFFLTEENLGKPRISCIDKLRHLNSYVAVEGVQKPTPSNLLEIEELQLQGTTCIIYVNQELKKNYAMNAYCRINNIKFISTNQDGVFSRIFVDNIDHEILDKDGEECQELFIKEITHESEGVVRLLENQKHNLQDGDSVVIYGVQGMDQKLDIIQEKNSSKQFNNSVHKITIINVNSFKIGDTTQFTPYERQGICKQLKVPIKIQNKSMEEIFEKISLDENMQVHDFMKLEHQQIIHICYLALDDFRISMQREPKPWDTEDVKILIKLVDIIQQDHNITISDFKLAEQFANTISGSFPPMQAFIGGFVAQEIIKSITNKFQTLNQLFYMDSVEVLTDSYQNEVKNNRYEHLAICLGKDILERLHSLNLFMVGVGALGCELIKNFAMLGISSNNNNQTNKKQGKITITDPDSIELSNLTRQFLFREKHITMPKSLTACASVKQMNPHLQIVALTEKVYDGTYNIFDDKFFESQDIIVNALDNVKARRYMDMRCVNSKKPLLESGTLGPKGHVQVILPYKTESYESTNDPQDEGEIPQCTLKMFPEEALHCVEWARDKFGAMFTLKPKSVLAAKENPNLELKQLKQAHSQIKKRPKDFNECIHWARRKFQKYFVNNILQLMYTYPLDAKTKEGKLFWSLPKRPPTAIEFNSIDQIHVSAIAALACLRAKVFKIKIPENSRSEKVKQVIALEALNAKLPQFIPSDQKAITMQEDNKIKNKIEIIDNPQEILNLDQSIIDYFDINGIQAEEFEKDNDQNYHIDFIHSLANIRCQNYKIDNMDWVTVKLKAGKIIPALATTTAAIAGLQTIELVKVVKECKVDLMKNAFLNLALPYLQLTEPGPSPSFKITENLTVSIWDRWEIYAKVNTQLKAIILSVEQKYGLRSQDVFFKGKVLFMRAIYKGPKLEEIMSKTLKHLIGEDFDQIEDQGYVDLIFTFSLQDSDTILQNIPKVRIRFDDEKK